MKTTQNILLIVAIVLVIYLIYYFGFKQKTTVQPPIAGGLSLDPTVANNPITPSGVPAAIASTIDAPLSHSREVAETEVSGAMDPNVFFKNINESNFTSFNLSTLPKPAPLQVIRFSKKANEFQIPCSAYAWYKSALYTYKGEQVDANTGIRTCYYSFDTGSLPEEIKVKTLGSCAHYNYYLANVQYKFNRTELSSMPNSSYCVYVKQ